MLGKYEGQWWWMPKLRSVALASTNQYRKLDNGRKQLECVKVERGSCVRIKK